MRPNDAVDADRFRNVLGRYPTGVAVITSLDGRDNPIGLTVGTFTSVSLDPPLVAFLPDKKSQSWSRIQPSGRFCVNILAEHQEEVCRTFARSAEEKFNLIGWHRSPGALPVIDDAVAWIECDLWNVFDAGDHNIVVGKVRAMGTLATTRPLLFFQGGYGRFSPGSMASDEAALSPWFRLLDRARPLMESISAELAAVVTATVVEHGDEVVIATAGGTSARVFNLVGSRQKLIPPVGLTHVAFSSDDVVARWLAPATNEARASLELTVKAVRERGYTIAVRSPELTDFARSWASADAVLPRADLPINPSGLDLEHATDLHSLHAPAFGPDGDVQMILNVFLLNRGDDQPTGADAARLLLGATRQLTESLADGAVTT
jgi:flavin reductase (DIM6/NTAB) family NADH-FMN oxidoreductase RutF